MGGNPTPLRICAECGKPERPHRMRHVFVPSGTVVDDESGAAIAVKGMAGELEVSADWTELVQTRISPRAENLLVAKLSRIQQSSRAAYLRRLIYLDIGLATTEQPDAE